MYYLLSERVSERRRAEGGAYADETRVVGGDPAEACQTRTVKVDKAAEGWCSAAVGRCAGPEAPVAVFLSGCKRQKRCPQEGNCELHKCESRLQLFHEGAGFVSVDGQGLYILNRSLLYKYRIIQDT